MPKPSNGKVARLPNELRHTLNTLLRDGFTYKQIIATLGDPVKHLTPRNLSNWRKVGYQRWLQEQHRLDRMRAMCQFSLQLARENEGAVIHQANLQTAASQIFELLSDFDAKSLQDKLDGDPQQYTRIVNSLARLSEGGLKYEQYRAKIAEQKAIIQKELEAAKGGGMTPEAIEHLLEKLNLL